MLLLHSDLCYDCMVLQAGWVFDCLALKVYKYVLIFGTKTRIEDVSRRLTFKADEEW
jgi:hypothetical protein